MVRRPASEEKKETKRPQSMKVLEQFGLRVWGSFRWLQKFLHGLFSPGVGIKDIKATRTEQRRMRLVERYAMTLAANRRPKICSRTQAFGDLLSIRGHAEQHRYCFVYGQTRTRIVIHAPGG